MTKRQATPAQQAAAKERRTKFSELCQMVAAMSEADRATLAARIMVTTIEGHALSLHNACLVAYQRENVTLVGGFHQWKQQGRTVRKGEHGLMIWCPTAGPREKEQTSESKDSPAAHPGFIMGTIFDISQTEPLQAQEAA